jgi:hypothetical protein
VKSRFKRVALITAAVALLGAIAAAISTAVAVGRVLVTLDGPRSLLDSVTISVILQASAIGGAFGLVAMPAVGWALLRRVPLGRAALYTAIGGLVGSFSGESIAPFNPYSSSLPGVISGAILGFIAAATALWFSYRGSRHANATVTPPNEEL